MLDSETKSRIDSARDILVGKVPDPKSQVEQITIALIYKFMDDMDRQSEELGGRATFFSGEYKKYAWSRLLDHRFSGHERLLLYAEGIEKMNENKKIPQLFRDIFKSVFLPYRDPETLNLFLKEINGFSYDHSERLGDAFEYLLSVMDSQGSAGQFRTPRHIIDFIVQIVDPRKNETILDPACGTAGFLISSYKHILAQNTKDRPGDQLTADERGRLMTNFCGYDISPDMVRLSRVNMYLHGFANPRIHEYDTLTSEERWDERYDVILANPPFMTPKGGIRPHNRFSIKAKRSEVLFVDYIAEHLNINGRAGIIVPEGIIFQSQNAYKKLRKMLIENYLWCVVSLPGGCFNPYSGVKTSILLMDKGFAKRTDEILFVKVESDGFDLGAQRRPNGKNDLPEALNLVVGHKNGQKTEKTRIAHLVSRKRILESNDCNLSGDRYRDTDIRIITNWPIVRLGDEIYFQIESGGTPESGNPNYWDGNICWTTLVDLPQDDLVTDLLDTQRKITEKGLKNSSAVLLPPRSVLVSSRATIGRIAITRVATATNQGFKNIVIKDFEKANERYVGYAVTQLVPKMLLMASGGTFKEISKTNFSNLEIPLPPLEVQEKIVAELDGYRKIIEGAKQVIVNYKPTIRIDPQWPTTELGRIAQILSGGTPSKSNGDFWNGSIPWVSPKDMKLDRIKDTEDHISKAAMEKSAVNLVSPGAILCVVRSGILAHSFPIALAMRDLTFNQDINAIVVKSETIMPEYLFHTLRTMESIILESGVKRGGTVHSLQSRFLHELRIPVPSLDLQRQIIAGLDSEHALVESNRRLVEIFERKIQTKLAEIWGTEKDESNRT